MGRRKKQKKIQNILIYIISVIFLIILGYIFDTIQDKINSENNIINNNTTTNITENSYDLGNIPIYTGEASVKINNNIPFFNENDFTEEPFERYSKLDKEKRCGVAFANICIDTMPKADEKRESISNVKNLSGWVQKEYPNVIGTRYLYNRCHLIGWQLSAENANIQNLMTGTAYLNYAMLEYENEVANYIKSNKNYHVLYRVTPIFEGDNKLASRCSNRGTVCRR